jgi:hypothetical protein
MGVANWANGDINALNKLLHEYAFNQVSYFFNRKNLIPDDMKEMEKGEMLKAYAEAVSYIVKKHFNLPAESSKYKAAFHGLDPSESAEQSKEAIMRAQYIIQDIEKVLEKDTSLKEFKTLVKHTLLEYFLKK